MAGLFLDVRIVQKTEGSTGEFSSTTKFRRPAICLRKKQIGTKVRNSRYARLLTFLPSPQQCQLLHRLNTIV